MIPTLMGRLQTRIFLLAVIGSLVQLIITPVLPGFPSGATLGDKYAATFGVLLAVGVLGLLWEFVYQFLMQFRWEKDWPTLFGFITLVNEGIVVWFVAKAGLIPGVSDDIALSTFLIDFLAVWIVTFLFVNGPMRVPFLRWRHTGGRLVPSSLPR